MANIEERRNKKGEITSYRIRVSVGYDVGHKQIMKKMTWTPPEGLTKSQIKRELERVAAEFETRCLRGQCIDDSIKFADFSEMWLRDYAENNLKKTTLTSYKTMLEKEIIPAIGHVSIGKIQPHHLNEFYYSLMNREIKTNEACAPLIDFKKYVCVHDGIKRDTVIIKQKELAEKAEISLTTVKVLLRGGNIEINSAKRICSILNLKFEKTFEKVERNNVKPATVKRYHALISAICSYAVYQNIIMVNPCSRVKTPRIGHYEAKYLEEDETEKLLNALETAEEPFRTAVKLLLFTGMRRGKLCGLEWEDIDFEKGIIHINKNTLYLKEIGIYEDTPKTYNSIRGVKISDYVLDFLREYREWQTGQEENVGDKWGNSKKIFTNDMGYQIHPDSLSKWFSKFNKKNGLKKISLHSLRHTSASLLIMSGVPINVVSKRLGHNNATTTSSIYTHVLRAADEYAAEALDNIILEKMNRA